MPEREYEWYHITSVPEEGMRIVAHDPSGANPPLVGEFVVTKVYRKTVAFKEVYRGTTYSFREPFAFWESLMRMIDWKIVEVYHPRSKPDWSI